MWSVKIVQIEIGEGERWEGRVGCIFIFFGHNIQCKEMQFHALDFVMYEQFLIIVERVHNLHNLIL